MIQGFATKSVQPTVVEHDLRLLGTGASAPSINAPTLTGITVTRVSAGVTKLTWSENPGTLHGMFFGLRATTPADLKGFTVVREAFNTTTFAVQFTLYDATGTAADLAAAQYIDILCRFKWSAA